MINENIKKTRTEGQRIPVNLAFLFTLIQEHLFPYNSVEVRKVGKLDGNGMWESSRIILPEHREAINEYRWGLKAKEKPILDEDEHETICRKILESYENRTEITLIMFDRFEDLRVIGVVERADPIGGRIRVDGEWFAVKDVIRIE